MGIPKYLLVDSLIGSISQRLVRKLCPKCKVSRRMTPSEMELLNINEEIDIFDPIGCDECNNTGYSGRTGVFEIMILSDEIKQIIMSDDFTSERISQVLKKEDTTILRHTRDRVFSGDTSVEEYRQLLDMGQ